MEKFVPASSRLFVVGDFNFHVDDTTNPDAKRFSSLLAAMDLQQHVRQPTHIRGHTLDLVITRRSENHLIAAVESLDMDLSDHYPVLCDLRFPKPSPVRESIVYRKLRNIDSCEFGQSFAKLELINKLNGCSASDSALELDAALSKLLDSYAPQLTKRITLRPNCSWFNDDIRDAKKIRRSLEKQWRMSGLEIHRQLFVKQKNLVNQLIASAKRKHFAKKIEENRNNPKQLFGIVDNLLERRGKHVLPSRESTLTLANEFADFFTEKIARIRMNLGDRPSPSMSVLDEPVFDGRPLGKFKPVTQDEAAKIVKNSPSKHCTLDSLPTWLLKSCLADLIPVLTDIINKSLESGIFPDCYKHAIVKPLLKKPSLDPECLQNYRPVSNLHFVSKVIERTVAAQLNCHLNRNGLCEIFQSAYKAGCSTETALLRVQNDILAAIDQGMCVGLVMLDLSAAFDTIDHQTLLLRLKHRLGISGSCLAWIKSYLTDRSQKVNVGTDFSTAHALNYGVPQGSVLGPLLYTIYVLPIGDIIREHGLEFHCFADDSQLYVRIKPKSTESKSKETIEDCVSDLVTWMGNNFLKVNGDKTDFILLGTTNQLSKLTEFSLSIDGSEIPPSAAVRNLGVVFDNNMSMEKHINQLCASSFYHLRNIGKIRQYLDQTTAERLVHAFVTSRLDYCNSLLFGLPDCLVSKVQSVQNAAARIITRNKKHCRITPVLRDLHWLPITSRINFKILVLTYKCIHGLAPAYLQSLVTVKTNTRNLRSSSQLLLLQPRFKLLSAGHRAFYYCAPLLWNKLPSVLQSSPSIDVFKSNLKTHLFIVAF